MGLAGEAGSFRNSAYVGPLLEQAMRGGPKVIWTQLGVIDQALVLHRRSGFVSQR